jgi:GAF domain-containing protein
MTSEAGSEPGERLQQFAAAFREQWADRLLTPDDIVEFAARIVPNTLEAGLTLVRGDGRPRTLAASSTLAAQVDTIECDLGEGPCIEAIEEDDLIVANDLVTDDRWPRFRARALAETSIRSMMGARIFLSADDRGALNFYAPEAGAFTQYDVGVAGMLSIVASLALQASIEQQKVTNLEAALDSSRQIGMAIGILMARNLFTPEKAFEELRRASQRLHRKVRDIAAEVNDTGTLP